MSNYANTGNALVLGGYLPAGDSLAPAATCTRGWLGALLPSVVVPSAVAALPVAQSGADRLMSSSPTTDGPAFERFTGDVSVRRITKHRQGSQTCVPTG